MEIKSANKVDQFIVFSLVLDSIENLVSNCRTNLFKYTTNIKIFEGLFSQVSATI